MNEVLKNKQNFGGVLNRVFNIPRIFGQLPDILNEVRPTFDLAYPEIHVRNHIDYWNDFSGGSQQMLLCKNAQGSDLTDVDAVILNQVRWYQPLTLWGKIINNDAANHTITGYLTPTIYEANLGANESMGWEILNITVNAGQTSSFAQSPLLPQVVKMANKNVSVFNDYFYTLALSFSVSGSPAADVVQLMAMVNEQYELDPAQSITFNESL